MAYFSVGDRSTDYDMKVKKGQGYFREKDIEDGFWGKISTIKCCIEPSSSFRKYKLVAQFNPDENQRHKGALYSKGGFWAGAHDMVKNELGGKYFASSEGDDEQTGFQIDIQQWKWGKKPEITVKQADSDISTKKIWFTFVSRPYFGYPEHNEQKVVLRISLLGAPSASSSFELIHKVDVTQIHDDVFGEGDDEKLENFHDYGALNLRGKGNSVHPKQLYTCNALLKTIREYYSRQKKINIGYIGPDTTENLRSVMRVLTNHEELKKKKYELHVLYEEDWDIPVAEHPYEDTKWDLSMAKLKPKPAFVSEILSGQKSLPRIDILVATYVGPWAVFTSQESKDNYQALLKQIITEKTQFITVDPMAEANAVVSHYKSTEIYGSNINLSDFYIGMDLSPEKMTWQQSCNPSVKVMRWTKEVKS